MKRHTIQPSFVEFMPDVVEEGVLYISITYKTATHKCACGCGEIVVTPIRPTDWTMTWDGDAVTLSPSIGNWSLPCKSHYLIEENQIIWAGRMSDWKIEAGRAKDRLAKTRYYGRIGEQAGVTDDGNPAH